MVLTVADVPRAVPVFIGLNPTTVALVAAYAFQQLRVKPPLLGGAFEVRWLCCRRCGYKQQAKKDKFKNGYHRVFSSFTTSDISAREQTTVGKHHIGGISEVGSQTLYRRPRDVFLFDGITCTPWDLRHLAAWINFITLPQRK